MRPRHPLAAVLLAALLAACSESAPRSAASAAAGGDTAASGSRAPDHPSVTAADTARVRAAERVLAAYLDASALDSPMAAALDTLLGCEAATERGADALPLALLASYHLLPFEIRDDTVVGRAVAISVGAQDRDLRVPGRYVAQRRVRADTLEWDIVEDPARRRMVVCNGMRFGWIGPDSLTTWRQQGVSLDDVRAIADSIRRGLSRRP